MSSNHKFLTKSEREYEKRIEQLECELMQAKIDEEDAHAEYMELSLRDAKIIAGLEAEVKRLEIHQDVLSSALHKCGDEWDKLAAIVTSYSLVITECGALVAKLRREEEK